MNGRSLLGETLAGLIELVYPPKCLVCGSLGPEDLCKVCRQGFRELPRPICPRCGQSLDTRECPACRFLPAENLAGARSAGVYEGTLRHAIIRLKYEGRKGLAAPLGRYLGECLAQRPFGAASYDVIVPIPLHSRREFDREFNQARLIADEVGKALALPVDCVSLIRTRPTRPQVDLTAAERRANVRGAFSVRDSRAVQGMSVLLIDDVATTLSTADSCAECLLAVGAERVYVATVARDQYRN